MEVQLSLERRRADRLEDELSMLKAIIRERDACVENERRRADRLQVEVARHTRTIQHLEYTNSTQLANLSVEKEAKISVCAGAVRGRPCTHAARDQN